MLQRKAVEADTLELLKELSTLSTLQDFVLVGGTSLALQIGHRKSIDLDFFTLQAFNPDELIFVLKDKYPLQVLQKTALSLICEIKGIKVDFIYFAYPFQYPVKHVEDIRLLAKEDIAPMKLDAICGRGSKKDFYDLYFLLQRFTLKKILNLYLNLYPHQSTFHVLRSLVYFEDAEQEPDPILIDSTLTWQQVKQKIEDVVKDV